MRKIILIAVSLLAVAVVNGQTPQRISCSTTLGTGITMGGDSYVPFVWNVMGHYNFNERISAGVGTGLLVNETTMIPVFADVKFMIIKPRMFTPYIECGAGYSFATAKGANGGLYINPSVGVQYRITQQLKVLFAVGYELQKAERVKTYEGDYFNSQFQEKHNYNHISFKVGVVF